MHRLPRLRLRGARPGPHRPGRRAARGAPPQPRATAWPSRRCATGSPRDAQVSVTLNLHLVRPLTDTAADLDAARRIDALGNRIFTGPMLRRRLPGRPAGRHRPAHRLVASSRDGDLAPIHQPLDVLGVNYYTPDRGLRRGAPGSAATRADGHGASRALAVAGRRRRRLPPAARASAPRWAGRSTRPACTTCSPGCHREHPGLPLMVTENGAAFDDDVGPDGRGPRPGADRLPARPPGRRAPRHRRRAPTSAATSCGR